MSLSPADLLRLSRLLDEAIDLAPGERAAWLAALPEAEHDLRERLRDMLTSVPALDSSAQPFTMPRLADNEAVARPGERVGPYRLLREIGRGGMGSVWLAERADGIFEREVALKLPRLSRRPGLSTRMARERQIGALLEHPHIARMYDAGIDETGRPYLVMERVPGGVNLLEHAQQQALDRDARLRLMLQVCAAVAHAHRHLVVHRDLKPSNLLVGDDGQVKLLDFGIAMLVDGDHTAPKSSSDETRRTHTPRYAAPEQRQGGAISTATDLYSLGVVLFELLTGTLPTRDAGAETDPPASLGTDLQAVLRRALRASPAERYSSAERLADDLQRVLARRPVAAAPAGTFHRLYLFGLRNRVALGVAALLVGLLGSAGLVVARQHSREQAQAERATQSREFLFDLLEDAEPLAGQADAPITGAEMVHSALARARQNFAGQPVLRGQVLTELGLMLRRLGQHEEALQVLGEADGVLEAHAAADDPALHIARAQWAIEVHAGGSADGERRATALANAALAGCSADSPRCAKARAYAHNLLQSQADRQGDRAAALLQARLELEDSERAFGPQDPEVAVALAKWAVVARNQGRLVEAAAALDRALAIAARAPLRAVDLRYVRLNHAVLLGDLGHHDAARGELLALLAEPAAASAHATQQRLLAQVLLAQGLLDEAQQAATAALATAQGAQDDWEAALAWQARARALSALGQETAAERDIAATLQGLRGQGLAEGGIELLRARRFAGEIALRAGRLDVAQARLAPLPALHRSAAGVLVPADLAQTLDLLGTLARRQGDAGTAVARHAEAAALLAAALPAGHPLRARNAVLAAVAAFERDAPGPATAADRAALESAILRYLATLPAGSAWRQMPDARTAGPADWRNLVL
jgi:serine/threonine-protein kinase